MRRSNNRATAIPLFRIISYLRAYLSFANSINASTRQRAVEIDKVTILISIDDERRSSALAMRFTKFL